MTSIFLTRRFILLLALAALSVTASDDALYKSYVLPESSSNISQHDSGTAISTRRCALRCMENEECNGFAYRLLNKKCSIETCVNPNLQVFDAVPDTVPGAKVKISSNTPCDVCIKKNKNVSAVIYCGLCDKQFCSQHKQVCQTNFCM
ncbi:hypothetical protein EB796_019225 [Bugula neritina]|uniref:Apple domain-containing protein n=1 Tax=Bugula neritina TaxID=10212 RepID=A0A7J7J8E5_BUGNE|nr:hypothetical protein EB796_019225 [Bugula neritina]